MVAEDGLIREHHFYWDQMEFLRQLGLLPEEASGGSPYTCLQYMRSMLDLPDRLPRW